MIKEQHNKIWFKYTVLWREVQGIQDGLEVREVKEDGVTEVESDLGSAIDNTPTMPYGIFSVLVDYSKC